MRRKIKMNVWNVKILQKLYEGFDLPGTKLKSQFFPRMCYLLKKEGWGGGGQRTLRFTRDETLKYTSNVQVIPPGFRGKTCDIKVPPGLLNTTRPTANYYQEYNFEREPWWPKFERLKNKFGITIIKGDRLHQSRRSTAKKPTTNSNQLRYNQNNSEPKGNGTTHSSSADFKSQGFNYLGGQILPVNGNGSSATQIK